MFNTETTLCTWRQWVNFNLLRQFFPSSSYARVPLGQLASMGLLKKCRQRGYWSQTLSDIQPDAISLVMDGTFLNMRTWHRINNNVLKSTSNFKSSPSDFVMRMNALLYRANSHGLGFETVIAVWKNKILSKEIVFFLQMILSSFWPVSLYINWTIVIGN